VSGGLLQHIFKSVVGRIAVPVVAPVSGSCTRISWLPLVKSAAVEVIADGVTSRKVIRVDVDVGELQHFHYRCVRLIKFGLDFVQFSSRDF
jgi:hypothetical protein